VATLAASQPDRRPGAVARRGIMRSRTGRVALVIVVRAGAVACTSDAARRSSAPAAPPTTAAHPATHPSSASVAANVSPQQLRAQFEQLGQHALLTMRLNPQPGIQDLGLPTGRRGVAATQRRPEPAGRDGLRRHPGRPLPAAVAGLCQRPLHLCQRRRQPGRLGQAAGPGRPDGLLRGLRLLVGHRQHGQVQPDDAVGTARTRVTGLTRQVDSYAARDYSQAYKLERDTSRPPSPPAPP
jgi:hypothetical protein